MFLALAPISLGLSAYGLQQQRGKIGSGFARMHLSPIVGRWGVPGGYVLMQDLTLIPSNLLIPTPGSCLTNFPPISSSLAGALCSLRKKLGNNNLTV